MNDEKIIELFFARDENAIKETEEKYTTLCHYVAKNYLADARGENVRLVAEYSDPSFRPYLMVGDYIIGRVPLSSSTLPGGSYSLNIKTGELKMITELN